ncbi:uncharacterized protein BDZ99DRAFT_569474 [Mytilinidion resinicola]|uniref:Uncharacterized protein n=1 Tax=Mytilinidion resinicola TaxID=574789 RepID=A0A6A6YRJ2_9PEZI|nr:uncharacterized protein BDZ99DRAFT_569474 [Mytilinidion resinicola]KAF2811420.1 hypothetical protein BDZ99DRAFT_569474 [Mytilinidion resinicola]
MIFITLLSLLYLIQFSIASPATKRQGGAIILPVLSVTATNTVVRLDEDTSKAVTEFFATQKCTRLTRRIQGAKRDDPYNAGLTNCMVDTFRALASNAAIVGHVMELYRGSPIAGDMKSIEALPQYTDEFEQAALVRSLVIGASMLQTVVNDINDIEIPWGVYIILNLVIQNLYNPRQSFTTFSVDRNGPMKKSCPHKEDNPCGHSLCRGGNNEICTAFLSPCECTKGDCPVNGQSGYLCDDADCGGADPLTGTCKGAGNGPHKGCPCYQQAISEGYAWDDVDAWNSAITEFEAIISGPDWSGTPAPPSPSSPPTVCQKSKDEVKNKPENWKFVDQGLLDQNIETFCNVDFKGIEPGAASGSYSRKYNDGGLEAVTITITWEGGKDKPTADCLKELNGLSSDCDWDGAPEDSNVNQYNWKWGGTLTTSDGFVYTIQPEANRVWLPELKPDQQHQWEISKQNKNGPRPGINGKELDMIILHQCLHDLKRHDWKSAGPYNCGGFVNFSAGHTDEYPNDLATCWDNTWGDVSWSLMNEGAISVYGIHDLTVEGGKDFIPRSISCNTGIDKF